jgi:hypothetical protein
MIEFAYIFVELFRNLFSQIFHTCILGNLVNSQEHFEANLKLDTQMSILKQMGQNFKVI